LPEPQAKKFIGFQKSLLGCWGVFRATFFTGFFGVVAVDSGAATATEVEPSGAPSDDWPEPALCADGGTAPAAIIGGATRDGASTRAVSAGCGGAAVTVIGGATRDGASARAVSAGCGGAAVTVIGGATRDGVDREGFAREACARMLAVVSGPARVVVMVGDVRCFAVTRWAGSERTANAVAEGWVFLAEGS
jgi:hypothetical protein